MKKMVVGALAGVLLGGSMQATDAGALVSIDSLVIMQKSTEGQKLATEIKKDIESFQGEVQKTQKELAEMQESLAKQSRILSKEAMQDKAEELNNKRKKLEREFADKEEVLRAEIQKKQMSLREKQLAVINKVFGEEKWSALLDKNTPGLLCVSDAIDRTTEVLSRVDKEYAASKKPATATKGVAKPALKNA